jgi:hypothetical protein
MSDQGNITRQERRVLAREQRRAAQRAAASALVEERRKEAEKIKEPRLKPGDALALAALPLGYAGMSAENNLVVGACLAISGLFACAPIVWHREIRKVYRILFCVFIAALCAGLFWIIKGQNLDRELSKNEGILTPDNQPRPRTDCRINGDDFAIFAGGGVWSGARPSTFLRVRGQDLVKMEATPSGDLRLKEIHLFDDLNESLVEIRDNKLWVHPNAHRERPDSHTLVVFDRRGQEALNLKFLNRNTLLMSGVFRASNIPPVRITDSNIKIGGGSISGNCISGVGTGFVIN